METIIGLLVILLPVIFKSIEKKLEKTGNYEQAKKIQDLARQMSLEEESPVSEPVLKPEPVMPVMDKPKVQKVQPVQKVQKPSKKKDQPMVEKDTVKKEKIDARKMVVYSEIMKRKF